MKKTIGVIGLIFFCWISSAKGKGEQEETSPGLAEAMACEETFGSIDRPALSFLSDTGLVKNKKGKQEEPKYEPGPGLLTILVGLIALISGAFSPVGILIAGGIFGLIGILLLLFYKKIKEANPFRMKGNNVLAKLIVALFFFLLLIILIGAIIVAFVVALSLLLAAILSTVVNPVVVAMSIIGLGVLWMLVSLVRYLIKLKRYKRSLKNG